MAENKRYKKSTTYKGVYQRKDGTWFFRIKKILTAGATPIYVEKSGFQTDTIAYQARQKELADIQYQVIPEQQGSSYKTFGEYFSDFLENGCDSKTSIKKYTTLYDSHLRQWADRDIETISYADIDVLLLKLSLIQRTVINKNGEIEVKNYSESYRDSIRKLLKVFFRYIHRKYNAAWAEISQMLVAKPYKLRVLSLFSGIGAPEQALKEMGIDYDLVNYCEIDDYASRAYCLLHNVSTDKRIKDITNIDKYYATEFLPDFDIMIFGFPCQSVSTAGNNEGIMKDGKAHPSVFMLADDIDDDDFTRSGLFYKALQIALWKKPKFMVAENVSALISKRYEYDFRSMVRNIQESGYNIYFKQMNSRDYGVPQNRPRVFMVMARDDLNMSFQFPEPIPKTAIGEDWIQDYIIDGVSDKYYVDMSKDTRLVQKLRENYDFKHFDCEKKEGYIRCITRRTGGRSYDRQAFVKDRKGIRCLTSEELMIFQGFPYEYGTILRENGFAQSRVGELIGNSITVPVIKAIFEQFVKCLSSPISMKILPKKIVEAQVDKQFIEPLFPYMGNKSKLLPYLKYLLPSYLSNMTFVDLFGGSAAVALNVDAKRIIINEIDTLLIDTYKALSATPPDKAWEQVVSISEKYQLPIDCDTKTYSCCPEYEGVPAEIIEKEYKPCARCKERYLACREDYNKIPIEQRGKYWYWGLALIYHSYNRSHVSYNSSSEYNSAFGTSRVKLSLSKQRFFPFAEKMYQGKYEFLCQSYKDFQTTDIPLPFEPTDELFFFYVDPPYLITDATYNKLWGETEERELYAYLDRATAKGTLWMLSNVLEAKGRTNTILLDWLRTRRESYNVYYMKRDYSNSLAQRKDADDALEIVVTNYPEGLGFHPLVSYEPF